MINSKKDLRSGQPVWTSYSIPPVSFLPLKSSLKTDVIVIGAGITGALISEELSGAGFKVVILDRREPLHGSTFATTALLQYEIDVPIIKLQKKIGLDNAIRAWRRSYLALNSLISKTKFLDISCNIQEEKSLYFAGNILNAAELKKEQQLRQQAEFQSSYCARQKLYNDFSLNMPAGLISLGNFSANPCQLAAGYLNKCAERGVKIFSPVEVINIKTNARSVQAHTKDGHVITARYLVFATGYEAPKQLRKQNYKIASTWAFATKRNVAHDLPMIWQASDPYLYIRNTKDGRIICGGEDEKFIDEDKRNALINRKTADLRNKLQKIAPHIDSTPEFQWCGSFGVTPTGMPMAGAVPGLKNCYSVMAFGGNGIINGRIGAEIIRGFLSGKADPDEDLYKFC